MAHTCGGVGQFLTKKKKGREEEAQNTILKLDFYFINCQPPLWHKSCAFMEINNNKVKNKIITKEKMVLS